MFDGKTFFGATGMPSRATAFVSTRLEDWLPEPLTVATRIVKSFTARAGMETALFAFRGSGPFLIRKERAACRETRRRVLPAAHVILHVGFCNAILRAAPQTTIALRVRVSDRLGHPSLNRVYRVDRGDESEAVVEFDNPFGMYALQIDAPRYGCSASDYVLLIAGQTRSVAEKLDDASAPAPRKPMLLP